jgi:hypothetical protein
MRRYLVSVALLMAIGFSLASAQSPLTDNFQLLRPELTISVFRDFTGAPPWFACNGTPSYGSAFECESWAPNFQAIGIGFDAIGAVYQITPNYLLGTTDIVRAMNNTTEAIARTHTATVVNLALDTTNGRLYLAFRNDGQEGIVIISGLPTMFDTLLTFIPGQQAINILTPAHPDGFRSADSLQVWTGNVRSMPDWSQAEPLTCEAAVSPAPGQLVSVADTLPDPAIGEGRYYLVASQSGADRRLGRQFVNGAFSAREPAGLPVCQ